MDGSPLFKATPKQLLVAAVIVLVATVVVAELVLALDRLVMARYDPTKIGEEAEDYLGKRETDEPE